MLGIDRSLVDTNRLPQVTNVNFLDKTFFDAIKKNDKDIDGKFPPISIFKQTLRLFNCFEYLSYNYYRN